MLDRLAVHDIASASELFIDDVEFATSIHTAAHAEDLSAALADAGAL